jgi:hypothetical protein
MKYKLRNGAIAKWSPRNDGDIKNGHCRVLEIISAGEPSDSEDGFQPGDIRILCFGEAPNFFPEGNAHGHEHDVIEEIKE